MREAASCLDHRDIARILPQAYPFVMIDRVIEFKKGESLTAVKNITANEWMFANPQWQSSVFPETLLLEAAAQAAILFYRLTHEESLASASRIFLGQVKAEFVRSVYAGDQVVLKTLSGRALKTGGYMDVRVCVKEETIADIQIFYSLRRD